MPKKSAKKEYYSWPEEQVNQYLRLTGKVPESFWDSWNGMTTAGGVVEAFLARGLEVPRRFWILWDGISNHPNIRRAYESRNLPIPKEFFMKHELLSKHWETSDEMVILKFVEEDENADGYGDDIY